MVYKSDKHLKIENQKFIPRRDLFPIEEIKIPKKNSTHTISSIKNDVKPINKRINELKSLHINPIIVLILALIITMAPKRKITSNERVSKLQTNVENTIGNPKTLDMIKSAAPYLDDYNQDILYTMAGILECFNIIKDLNEHTYHDRHKARIANVPSNPQQRKVELIKTLKSYFDGETKAIAESCIKLYETSDKITRNIKNYNEKVSSLDSDRKITIKDIGDLIDVVAPIIPEKYQEKAAKLSQVIKIAALMDVNKVITSDKKENFVKEKTNDIEQHENNNVEDESKAQMIDSIKTMLNEEQQKSFDAIMKMAELLSQPSDELKNE